MFADDKFTDRTQVFPDENFSQNFSFFSFLEFLYNFSEFPYNFITFSHFFIRIGTFLRKSTFFSQNCSYMLIMKYRKIFKIFCKCNFWWNVTKSKKIFKYFLKIVGWEIQNILEFTCMRSSERRCKLSEYFQVFLKNIPIRINNLNKFYCSFLSIFWFHVDY